MNQKPSIFRAKLYYIHKKSFPFLQSVAKQFLKFSLSYKILYIVRFYYMENIIGISCFKFRLNTGLCFRIPLYFNSMQYTICFSQIVSFLLLFCSPKISICPYFIVGKIFHSVRSIPYIFHRDAVESPSR